MNIENLIDEGLDPDIPENLKEDIGDVDDYYDDIYLGKKEDKENWIRQNDKSE